LFDKLINVCRWAHEYEKIQRIPVSFQITPDSLRKVSNKDQVPNFLITGKINSSVCSMTKPFTGELIVNQCDAAIKAIELQLIRVETCGCAEGYAKEATEVQNIRIAEGDVLRGIVIPIFMILPRLFSCPSLAAPSFKVGKSNNIHIL
jgi:hypothetical protein